MRTHAPIIDCEFLRENDPDMVGQVVHRLMRLGGGKAYLAGGDALNYFLSEEELGIRWEEFFQGQYGLFYGRSGSFEFSDAEHYWTGSNYVLSCGAELSAWAESMRLPVYGSVKSIVDVASRRPFAHKWEWLKGKQAVLVIGRQERECASWRDVFRKAASGQVPEVFNVAALLDHHLFQQADLEAMVLNSKPGIGLQNLMSILEGYPEGAMPRKLLVAAGVWLAQMPRSLKNHLEPAKRPGQFALNEDAVREVHFVLREQLGNIGFDGELEFVGLTYKSPEMHFREVMTNHHLFHSDRGFNVFGHDSGIFQNDCSMANLVHDIVYPDDQFDGGDAIVDGWRKNLVVLKRLLNEGVHHCVNDDGVSCHPSELQHPFILPLEDSDVYHDG